MIRLNSLFLYLKFRLKLLFRKKSNLAGVYLFGLIINITLAQHILSVKGGLVDWNSEVVSLWVGNLHFFVLLFCPLACFNSSQSWPSKERRKFYQWIDLGSGFVTLSQFILALSQLVFLFCLITPGVGLLYIFGFNNHAYLISSVFQVFLLGCFFLSLNIFILKFVKNIVIYFFASMMAMSVFYLIGILASKTTNFVLISLLRKISFAVNFQNIIEGVLSPSFVFFLFSCCTYFLFLSYSAKRIRNKSE